MKIQEIAKLADVSPSTVSRVFSHHPKISEEVRQRVMAIAQKYNYHPRLSARQRNIVILTPGQPGYPAHFCVDMLVMALTTELTQENFCIEILPWNNRDRLKFLHFYGAAAIGINADEFRDWNSHYPQPLVVLDRELPAPYPGVWQVSSDERQAMKLAVQHFKERNVKNIGCVIYGTSGIGNADLRRQAAHDALKSFGYDHDDSLFWFASQSNCVEVVGKLLKCGVDALLCPGSSGGLLTAYALGIFGKRIPDDVSLISSELSFFSPFGTPPQTTFCPDYVKLAKTATAVFLATLNGENYPWCTVLPYTLLKRESVRRS